MSEHHNSVTVMGDLFVEFSVRVEGVTFQSLERDALYYGPIRMVAGGTAMNFALAAADHFRVVNILGRVGRDALGGTLLNAGFASNVSSCIEASGRASTGTAIYLRDSSKVFQNGVRFLVVDRGANMYIDHEYIEKYAAVIAGSDLFFLDSYSFLEEPRRSASESAMCIAKSGGAAVALDLVPHDAHLHFRTVDVERWVNQVDLVIAEVRTIRRVFGFHAEEEVLDPAIAQATWEMVHRKFPATSFYLRFGFGNIDRSLLCEVGRMPLLRENGYLGTAEARGFGDRLSAVDLGGYLSRRPNGPSLPG
jgi:sugar/nucleoside kinase (ribokinase family)